MTTANTPECDRIDGLLPKNPLHRQLTYCIDVSVETPRTTSIDTIPPSACSYFVVELKVGSTTKQGHSPRDYFDAVTERAFIPSSTVNPKRVHHLFDTQSP
jgi:hypothetical protein